MEWKSSLHGYGRSEQTPTNHAQLRSFPAGEEPVKNKEALKREIRERIANSVDVDAQIVPPPTTQNVYGTADVRLVALDAPNSKGLGRTQSTLTGMDFFQYWLWRCRSDQMDWSLHPLRKFNPKAPVFLGELLTQIQE